LQEMAKPAQQVGLLAEMIGSQHGISSLAQQPVAEKDRPQGSESIAQVISI